MKILMHPNRLNHRPQPHLTPHARNILRPRNQVKYSCSPVIRPRLAGQDEQRKEVRTGTSPNRTIKSQVYQRFQIFRRIAWFL